MLRGRGQALALRGAGGAMLRGGGQAPALRREETMTS